MWVGYVRTVGRWLRAEGWWWDSEQATTSQSSALWTCCSKSGPDWLWLHQLKTHSRKILSVHSTPLFSLIHIHKATASTHWGWELPGPAAQGGRSRTLCEAHLWAGGEKHWTRICLYMSNVIQGSSHVLLVRTQDLRYLHWGLRHSQHWTLGSFHWQHIQRHISIW